MVDASPAHKGGIKQGDVIVEMDSAPVTHTAQAPANHLYCWQLLFLATFDSGHFYF